MEMLHFRWRMTFSSGEARQPADALVTTRYHHKRVTPTNNALAF
jgi:hypothetical protein